jgi:hypothetical protein
MNLSVELDPAVREMALALGVVIRTASGTLNLEPEFFRAPWSRVSRILADEVQRCALVAAIDLLIDQFDPSLIGTLDAPSPQGQPLRSAYPLLAEDAPGQILIVLTRDGLAPGAPLQIGLAAEVRAAGGPGAMAEVVLISAEGSTLRPVAGSANFPLNITVTAPLGTSGQTIAASLAIVAPPDHEQSRFKLYLDIGNGDPVTIDLTDAQSQIGRMAVLLLDLVLGQIDSLPDAATRLMTALPGLAGLPDGMPEFPFGRLIDDPTAFRNWIAALATLQLADGSIALSLWLQALGTLIDVPVLTGSGSANGTILLQLAEATASHPAITLGFTVVSDAANGTAFLEIDLSLIHEGIATVDARIRAEALMLTIPLSGPGQVRALDRFKIVIEATASGNPLVPLSGSGSNRLGIGSLEAGLSVAAAADIPQVLPVLQLSDVTIDLAGSEAHFAKVDFTQFTSLTSAAVNLLKDELEAGLGPAGAQVVDALKILAGLGTVPALDLSRLATNPGAALNDYYRAMLATQDGWRPIATALGYLLGNTTATSAQGVGTADEPWAVILETLSLQADGNLAIRLECWNGGTASAPSFVLGLRIAAEGPGWDVGVRIGVVDISLVASTGHAARWLPLIELVGRADTSGQRASLSDIKISAQAAILAGRWAPGGALSIDAKLFGIIVSAGEDQHELGSLDLGDLLEIDPALPDLGIGINAQAIWPALLLLLAQSARRLAGEGAEAILAAIGVATPEGPGRASRLPPLALPPRTSLAEALRDPASVIRAWLLRLTRESEQAVVAGAGPAVSAALQLFRAIALGTFDAIADIAILGGGTLADPWRIPLITEDSAASVTLWLGPDGPPKPWSAYAMAQLTNPQIDAEGLLQAASALCGHIDRIGPMLAGRSRADMAQALARFDEFLANGDGILPLAAAAPVSSEWELGRIVDCGHTDAPSHPAAVAQATARIEALTGSLPANSWSVILLAPAFAGPGCWDTLVTAVGDNPASIVPLSLRSPGIPPQLADPGIVPPVRWYSTDIGDDGTSNFANSVAALQRAVDAVLAVRPGAKILLVSHSYLGLVAEAYASLHLDTTLGLIALAAPLGPPIMSGIVLAEFAEAVLITQALAPQPAANNTLRAINQLGLMLDGYPLEHDSQRIAQIISAPCWWRQEAPPALTGVPALAIPAQLIQRPVEAIASALAAEIGRLVRTMPSDLHWGIEMMLDVPGAPAGEVQAEVCLALELGSVALADGKAPPLPGRIALRTRLWRDSGWLVDGPALDGSSSGRLRRAELAVTITPLLNVTATEIAVHLDDICVRGNAAVRIGLDDPRSAELLALTIAALGRAGANAPGAQTVLDLLADLGFVRPSSRSATAKFFADAVVAAQANAAGWFNARLPPLLDRPGGILGLQRAATDLPGGGPWRFALPGLPLECRIDKAPWRVSVAVTGAGLRLADAADISGVISVRADTLVQKRDWVVALAGIQLEQASSGVLQVDAAWLDKPLSLFPPDPDTTASALAKAIPRFLVDGVVRALVEEAFGRAIRLPSLHPLLTDPGRWLQMTFVDAATGLPDGDRLAEVVALLTGLAGLESDAAHPLRIPGLLGITINEQMGALVIGLDTLAPAVLWQKGLDDATLSLSFGLTITPDGHVDPAGTISLRLPLPDTSYWGGLDIAIGASASGASLTLASDTGIDLTLLPQFGGLETLIGPGAQMLLPLVLDQLALTLPAASATKEALDVANAFGIYDNMAAAGQGFQSKSAEIAALVKAVHNGNLKQIAPAIARALVPLLQKALGQSVSLSASNGEVTLALSGVLGGSVSLNVDFAATPPDLKLKADGIDLAPVALDLEVGVTAGDLVCKAIATLGIDAVPGITLEPTLAASLTAPVIADEPARLQVNFAPDGPAGTAFELAPNPTPPSDTQLQSLLENWLIPLAGNIILHFANPLFDHEMWSGGKTVGDLVVSTALVTHSGPGSPYLFTTNLPQPLDVLSGVLNFLNGIQVPLTDHLSLSVLSSSQVFGLGLTGSQNFEIDPYALTLYMGLPQGTDLGWGDRGKAVGLLLLDLSNSTDPKFAPVIRLNGLGISLGRKKKGEALVDADGFRLRAVGGYLSLDIDLSGTQAPTIVSDVYGAIDLSGLGLMIDARGDGGNAVAASLIKSSSSGDATPAIPSFDMLVGKSPQGFAVSFSGQPKIRIEINRTMGPLHIKEMALVYTPISNRLGELGIALDASIAMAGIQVVADDLGVYVPLDLPTDLSQWRIDLSGLAVDYSGSGFSIGGGLQKATLPDGSIEYRGALSVNVAAYGFSAIGAYARLTDGQGSYTSLFMFLAISAPIGGPPYLFVTGLAGGAGYNRRLLTPRDPVNVPGFPLVQAMDDDGGNLMDQLKRIGSDIPPARGALWVAAGIRFSTFELLHTTALLSVQIDRGFEISLMGLMRLQLPPAENAAIVSLELALSAKYSTIDQVLSIRAELTDNSWLISRDCKLTGGFAFLVWFGKPEALLTLGGYSRNFIAPDHYPIVPRVGFHWNVDSGIVIKGGAFFAITHSAAMVGGSLEASYAVGPVRAWFIADLDVIVSWDPFCYQASAFVEVGVEINLQVCLFGKCISAPPLRINIGTSLQLEGPPLNGLVIVDAGITTIRIPFGHKEYQPFLKWEELRDKYLGEGTSTSISAGAMAGDGKADGTTTKPWLVACEFQFRVESKMPATALEVNCAARSAGGAPARVDLVPAGTAHGPVTNCLKITIEHASNAGWLPLSPAEIDRLELTPVLGRFPGAVWDGAASYMDSQGNRVADTSRPMLSALANAEFACTPEIVEATGALADLKLATMVEEKPPRAMAFSGRATDSVPPTPLVPIRGPAGTVSVTPMMRLIVDEAVTVRQPTKPTEPSLSTIVRSRMAVLTDLGTTATSLAAASIWTIATNAAHRVTLSGIPTRIVAISATGKIMADRTVSDSLELDAGIHSLVFAGAAALNSLGWEAGDNLVQAGPATFIAPGAVITTPMPWSPRRSSRRLARGRSAFNAARLTRSLDELVTRMALTDSAVPTTLLVRLDRTGDAADLAAITIAVSGAQTGARRIVERKGRMEMVFALTLDPGSAAIEVKVTTGAYWRLAGVLALTEELARITRRLRRNNSLRLSSTMIARPIGDLVDLPSLEIL